MERIVKMLIKVIYIVAGIIFITIGIGSIVLDWWAVDEVRHYFLICLITLIICQYLLLPLLHKDRWKNVKRFYRRDLLEGISCLDQPLKDERINFSKRVIKGHFLISIYFNFFYGYYYFYNLSI